MAAHTQVSSSYEHDQWLLWQRLYCKKLPFGCKKTLLFGIISTSYFSICTVQTTNMGLVQFYNKALKTCDSEKKTACLYQTERRRMNL